jgi:phosphatidate cytidylyltransferase
MIDSVPSPVSLGILALLTLLLVAGALGRGRFRVPAYFRYLWAFFLLFSVADWWSFRAAIWMFAVFSFVALREFFSLLDIRLQDRWGILGAYVAIPFMIYYIHTNWYGMFIISIPVYTFVVIPFLVAVGGGEARGTVFSIGAIDLGLFLFAYCMGHIGYLAFFSVRIAMMVVIVIALSDLVYRRLVAPHPVLRYLVAAVLATSLAIATSRWTTIPLGHSAILGAMLPLLVFGGRFTLRVIEDDLGVVPRRLEPGRGLVLDTLTPYLFPAPIAFHYLRWFLDWGRFQ